MITSLTGGKRKVIGSNPDDTTFHVLVSADAKYAMTVESITVSCGSSDTAFTLTYKDGSDEYLLENARVIEAHKSYSVPENILLPLSAASNQSIRIKAGTADRLSIVAVVIETPPVQDFGGRGFQYSGMTGGQHTGWLGAS